MKLNSAKITALNDGSERGAMITTGHRERINGPRVAVHKIEAGFLINSLEQGGIFSGENRIPAHVGHLNTWGARQQVYLARNQAQGFRRAFGRGFEQELHAETNPEDRLG